MDLHEIRSGLVQEFSIDVLALYGAVTSADIQMSHSLDLCVSHDYKGGMRPLFWLSQLESSSKSASF